MVKHPTKNADESETKVETKVEMMERWVHLPPSQQSAQGPVAKPGEFLQADSPEVVAPKVKKVETKVKR